MKKRLYLFAALLGLFTMASAQADAAMLMLNFSGEFGPTTTLGGTALGADTAFTFAATFDTTTGISKGTGVEIFPTVATFNISGFGTFTSVAGADVYVGLADPTSNSAKVYEAVLTNGAITHDFGAAYSTATPPITAANPAPTVFSGLFSSGGFLNLTIPLQGGAGDLVVKDLAAAGEIATITAATVPEPASLTLSAMGLALVGFVAWRRNQRSS
jgi:hypothetical protein